MPASRVEASCVGRLLYAHSLSSRWASAPSARGITRSRCFAGLSLALIAGSAVQSAEASYFGNPAPKACERGFFQKDSVALACVGGTGKALLVLSEAGRLQSEFTWRAPRGTRDLAATFSFSAPAGTGSTTALSASCSSVSDHRKNASGNVSSGGKNHGRARLIGGFHGLLSSTRAQATDVNGAKWAWSGNPPNHSKVVETWFLVSGALRCDMDIVLSNLGSARLVGEVRYRWAAVTPCPKVVLGCVPCPEDVCNSDEHAVCDGGRHYDCLAQRPIPAVLARERDNATRGRQRNSSGPGLVKHANGASSVSRNATSNGRSNVLHKGRNHSLNKSARLADGKQRKHNGRVQPEIVETTLVHADLGRNHSLNKRDTLADGKLRKHNGSVRPDIVETTLVHAHLGRNQSLNKSARLADGKQRKHNGRVQPEIVETTLVRAHLGRSRSLNKTARLADGKLRNRSAFAQHWRHNKTAETNSTRHVNKTDVPAHAPEHDLSSMNGSFDNRSTRVPSNASSDRAFDQSNHQREAHVESNTSNLTVREKALLSASKHNCSGVSCSNSSREESAGDVADASRSSMRNTSKSSWQKLAMAERNGSHSSLQNSSLVGPRLHPQPKKEASAAVAPPRNSSTNNRSSTSLASVSLCLINISYAQLVAHAALLERFQTSVRGTIAAAAGLPSNFVALTLSPGSVIIDALVLRAPPSTEAQSNFSSYTLNSSTAHSAQQRLSQASGKGWLAASVVRTLLSQVPNISTVTAGQLAATHVEVVLSAEDVSSVDCGYWAKTGECQKNPEFMTKRCAASCEALPQTPNNSGLRAKSHAAPGANQTSAAPPVVAVSDGGRAAPGSNSSSRSSTITALGRGRVITEPWQPWRKVLRAVLTGACCAVAAAVIAAFCLFVLVPRFLEKPKPEPMIEFQTLPSDGFEGQRDTRGRPMSRATSNASESEVGAATYVMMSDDVATQAGSRNSRTGGPAGGYEPLRKGSGSSGGDASLLGASHMYERTSAGSADSISRGGADGM